MSERTGLFSAINFFEPWKIILSTKRALIQLYADYPEPNIQLTN